MQYKSAIVIAFLAAAELVSGHGAIVRAVGDAGGQGSAIGIKESTPRDGTRRNPFQTDSTRFKGEAAGSCGETIGGGTNSVRTGVRRVMAKSGGSLPQVTPGGSLEMTLHQVNGDGAGPYTCMIDETGTGTSWSRITVDENVPGRRGNSRARATDFTLRAEIPDGTQCTGTVNGEQNVCMVRCQNPARAGPFGGCVPVQMAEKNVRRAVSDKAARSNDKQTAQKAQNNKPQNKAQDNKTQSTKVQDNKAQSNKAQNIKAQDKAQNDKAQEKAKPAKSSQVAEEELDGDMEFLSELRADGEEI